MSSISLNACTYELKGKKKTRYITTIWWISLLLNDLKDTNNIVSSYPFFYLENV